ncbi:MAG: DUF222 domain-containing protein [Acidimicrobiales bacterium]|jgi:hypothetical protein
MKFETLQRVADDLRTALSGFDPELVDGPDAARLLEVFAEIEKLAAGGKLLAARRVESSNIWRRTGHRSAAAHVAEATGTGMGPAITALEAARQLGSLPATDEAMRKGRLSEAQVKEIAGAAVVHPGAEQELVEAAGKQPMSVLKLRCRRVRASGQDQNATYAAIRRRRYLRNWIDDDGAVRLDARLTPDEGARLVAAVKYQADRLARQARRAGVDEPNKAVAADALVLLACGVAGTAAEDAGATGGRNGSTRPRTGAPGTKGTVAGPATMLHVRVDHAALVRGHLEPGEICEIPGIGPIPVDVARRLAVDSILSVLVTDGVDVMTVAHAGRTIPASLRRALIERDQVCAVPGCDVREALEIDHVDPFSRGGPTRLANLVRLCHWHHYLKTHQRHRIERTDGGWRWRGPDGSRTGGVPLDRSG